VASVRILSSNVNLGFDVSRRRFVLPALREAVHRVGADIVFLQEILGEHTGHARRHAGWPTRPQHEYLADSLWPHHAYGRNAVFDEGHQGNALLSKFEIMDYQNRDVSLAGHEPRGLLHGVLALPGHVAPLHVISVHLGLRESHRRHQIGLLCRMVESEIPAAAPLVVAGDFNDWRARGHAALHAAGLQEIFLQAWGRLARTFPARFPVLPLDRIYVRNAQVQGLGVLSHRPWSQLSDHAALFAEITPHNGA
jgi:endonuclease/exonuclease/phosphatase family metal-dependent hydrolase